MPLPAFLRRLSAGAQRLYHQSSASDLLHAVSFVLYTVIFLNIFILLRPFLHFTLEGRRHQRRERLAQEYRRRAPRRRRRRRGSLDGPPTEEERGPRRQLSVTDVGGDTQVQSREGEALVQEARDRVAIEGVRSHDPLASKPLNTLLSTARLGAAKPTLARLPSTRRPTAAQSGSLLLTRLPLELRQEIYRLVLAGRHTHFVRLGGDDFTSPQDFVLNNADYRTRDTFQSHLPSARTEHPNLGAFLARASMRVPPWRTRDAATAKHWAALCAHTSMLALPLTCRQVYVESIRLLYQSVVFKVSRLFTLTDLSVALLPQRFAAIRSLEICYELRCGLPLTRAVAIGEDADWLRAWTLLATRMSGLRALRIDLFAFDIRALMDAETDAMVTPEANPAVWRWLGPMLLVTGLKSCHAKLHHVHRFNEAFVVRQAPVSWFAMVVTDALERLIGSALAGRRLPEEPPGIKESESVKEVWRTVREVERQGAKGLGVVVEDWKT